MEQSFDDEKLAVIPCDREPELFEAAYANKEELLEEFKEKLANAGIEQAIRFLSQQFRGGTDLASCFRAIMERLQSREWFDADAVVISDFIAQRLPDDVTSKVKELQRVHQHRFHAVAMSAHGKPGIMRIFDHIWRFDTGMRSRLLRRWRR